MSRVIAAHHLGKLLVEEGLLPKECCDVELLMPVEGVLQLRYSVNVPAEDIPMLIRALAALAESMEVEP